MEGACTYHPERLAVGICIACRQPICIECSTPIEGIHRCPRCLAGLAVATDAPRWEGREVNLASLFLSLLGLSVSYALLRVLALAFEG
ncbi:MAG: hypothetical protein D6729_11160 [Deltaproteobacteria bacterium]|nr:MAG: hypothetical protein D6729_11160 [Deltaproteobacteria bacterium]